MCFKQIKYSYYSSRQANSIIGFLQVKLGSNGKNPLPAGVANVQDWNAIDNDLLFHC